jgi:glycogen operon protein
MTEEDWDSGFGRAIAVYLNGNGIPGTDTRGQRIVDDSFVLCFSAHDEPIEFRVPPEEYGAAWEVVVDTLNPEESDRVAAAGSTVTVGPRALVVLQQAG